FSGGAATLAPGASTDFTCTFTIVAGNNNGWTADGVGTDQFGAAAPSAGEHQAGNLTGILGKVIVVKHTLGGNGPFSFGDSGTDLTPFTITTSGGTGTMTFTNVHSGAKSVTETVPTGWIGNTTNVACAETSPGITASIIGSGTTGEVAAGGT